MSKDVIELEGTILEAMPNAMFRVNYKEVFMVLENKLGLTNSADLAREEERISKTKAVKMFETGFLDELKAGNFETLSKIP